MGNESKFHSNGTKEVQSQKRSYFIFFLHAEINQMEVVVFFFPTQYQSIHILERRICFGIDDDLSFFFFFFLIIKMRKNSFFLFKSRV